MRMVSMWCQRDSNTSNMRCQSPSRMGICEMLKNIKLEMNKWCHQEIRWMGNFDDNCCVLNFAQCLLCKMVRISVRFIHDVVFDKSPTY